jgi:hypothetical protein
MARKRTPVLNPPPKEETQVSEARFHELIAAHTGYSQEVVKRVVQAYWQSAVDSFEDCRVVEIPNLRFRLGLVYAEPKYSPVHLLNRKRLYVMIDSPKYFAQRYKVRVRKQVYGKWVNMRTMGHQFIEL